MTLARETQIKPPCDPRAKLVAQIPCLENAKWYHWCNLHPVSYCIDVTFTHDSFPCDDAVLDPFRYFCYLLIWFKIVIRNLMYRNMSAMSSCNAIPLKSFPILFR